jgi:hypothetical protein
MVHKPIAIMILSLALTGILILAVLTAMPSNNHAFAGEASIPPPVYPHHSNSTGNGTSS